MTLGNLHAIALAGLVAAATQMASAAMAPGPESLRFVVAGRKFEVDSRRDPRMESPGLSFDARDLRLFDRPGVAAQDTRLSIAAIGEALPAIPTGGIERRWDEAGLACVATLADDRRLQHCIRQDETGRIVTSIDCRHPGGCVHRFDRGGLRYTLHCDPADIAAWRDTQRNAIELVAGLERE